jgi:ATP-dependent DNA helicase 2 subunit 2
MLFSIAKEVHGDVKSVSKRMDMLTQGNKRAVSQVTKFRGLLEIGTTMGLPVHCYLKTKIATLPTLKKESQVSHDKNISGRIKMDRIYRSSTAMQENDNEIPIEKRVKAYRYGSEKVPFSSADMESFKFQTEKSLKLLGFVDQNQLKIAQFIGETDLFIRLLHLLSKPCMN